MIPPLLAIFSYPVVVVVLFRLLEPRSALIWTILLGYLFLPTRTAIDLPLLPAIDKDTVPAIAALCGMAAVAPGLARQADLPLPGWIPRNLLIRITMFAIVGGSFLTVMSNLDALSLGVRWLRGLSIYDGFSSVLSAIMSLLVMLMARKFLAGDESQRALLRALAVAGAIYSLPIIYELIMSPQMNKIVYGFFPHSWRQHVRGDGYRPLVFLSHGLWLGIFLCVTVLAAFGYARTTNASHKLVYFGLGAWLLVLLLLMKSLGAALIALILMPAVLFMTKRAQLLLAAILAAIILIYPLLRGNDLIPVDRALAIAASISSDRAGSLGTRLVNEDRLLAKANQRPVFGWGGWGRSRVFNEKGEDISLTDGIWVAIIGKEGWVGYLGNFGLLCFPLILLAMRRNNDISPTTSILSLVFVANLIDLIPNATLTPVTWLIAGSLIGRLEGQKAGDRASEVTKPAAAEVRLRRTRFGPEAGYPDQGTSIADRKMRKTRFPVQIDREGEFNGS